MLFRVTAPVICPTSVAPLSAASKTGSIRSIVATNALELGVDIGGLDAAVLNGYPGSIASAWQQMGRVGRREGTSLAIYVASFVAAGSVSCYTPGLLLLAVTRSRAGASRQP